MSIVAFHNKLVSANYEFEAIIVVKMFRDVLTKSVPRASWADACV